MPPRRHARGRHRRPKNTGGPAYVTAATLAAFTVSGINVPDAIGDARQAASSTSTAQTSSTDAPQRVQISAVALRDTLAEQQEERASRLRVARVSMIRAAQQAAEQARAEAEARRPKWVLPVVAFRLTAGFGDWGLWSGTHTGQDFAAPAGSPVRSVGDGRIVSTGYDGAYGNKIVVEHADGTVTWYCHLLGITRTDGTVKAGEIIGSVGSTGNSTGDHLHLEVRPGGGDPVPPLTWLRRQGVRI
ncbi:MAG: M23 family metallopeptidase [Sporichthyaceae bacterium]|nr:M23 family metallopeptidase [Sporichthyaceae bacterium]